jgi:hypothetical protein
MVTRARKLSILSGWLDTIVDESTGVVTLQTTSKITVADQFGHNVVLTLGGTQTVTAASLRGTSEAIQWKQP